VARQGPNVCLDVQGNGRNTASGFTTGRERSGHLFAGEEAEAREERWLTLGPPRSGGQEGSRTQVS
jgi:hypothetical protein